jgi:hypothetical protein
MIDINLHSFQDDLSIKNERGKIYIFDIIRKKYLILQPEEMVRQLLIHFLIHKGYPKEKIQVEKGLNVNGLQRRFDIIVYDPAFEPYLLVECKSYTVQIDQSTFDQMANYNLAVKAPYLLACNGVQTFCCKLNFESKLIEHLNDIPYYNF